MTEQQLDDAEIGAKLEQMHRKGMAEHMRRDRFGQAGEAKGLLAGHLDGLFGDVLTGQSAREQPLLRTDRLPIGTQDLQQFL